MKNKKPVARFDSDELRSLLDLIHELDLRENFDEALVGNDWTEYL